MSNGAKPSGGEHPPAPLEPGAIAPPKLPVRASIYIDPDGSVHFGALFEGLVPVAEALSGKAPAAPAPHAAWPTPALPAPAVAPPTVAALAPAADAAQATAAPERPK